MTTPGTPTVVTDPLHERLLMWIGLPALGAAALWGLKLIARWVADLSWAPFQGAFRLAADIPEPTATIAALAIGTTAGLVLAFFGHVEALTLTIDDDTVEATKDGHTTTLHRTDVHLACLSGKELVILDTDGGEPLRATTQATADTLAAAFTAHGYTWTDTDPHTHRFTRWVDGAEGLPPGANAILKAR